MNAENRSASRSVLVSPLLVLLAVWLVSTAGCGPRPPPNVVLVSVDTLRTDALGANLLTKNERRDIPNTHELRRRLSAWLDQPVLVLGEHPDDVPDHHLAMTWTPLGDRVALVGDPRLAKAIVGPSFDPAARSPETQQPLGADFSAETVGKFERVAEDLKRAGYTVVRIPNIPLDPKTYVTYTNGVYETRAGRRIAYLPQYGIESLDAAARQIYVSLGWTVSPIRVARVYPYHGTIGCLVNVVERRR